MRIWLGSWLPGVLIAAQLHHIRHGVIRLGEVLVILGVGAELGIHNASGSVLTEVRGIQDSMIASANKGAAEANERAGNLELKAATLSLEPETAKKEIAIAQADAARANERAINLQIELAREEEKNRARRIETTDLAAQLKGKVEKVYLMAKDAPEPRLLALQIAIALRDAGIAYAFLQMPPRFDPTGVFVFTPESSGPFSTLQDPVFRALLATGVMKIPLGNVLSAPSVTPRSAGLPLDGQIIVIGEKDPDFSPTIPLPPKNQSP